jgi:hypothetical protein
MQPASGLVVGHRRSRRGKYVWVLAWCCAVLNERFNHACATAKEKALYRASSYLSDATQVARKQVIEQREVAHRITF